MKSLDSAEIVTIMRCDAQVAQSPQYRSGNDRKENIFMEHQWRLQMRVVE